MSLVLIKSPVFPGFFCDYFQHITSGATDKGNKGYCQKQMDLSSPTLTKVLYFGM